MYGLLATIMVSVISIAISTLIGFFGAAIRIIHIPVLSQIVVAYVEIIRNTPILGQLFLIFYGLPSIGLTLSLFWSGVLTLSLWAGAYQIENIRGGIETVSKGLKEAAFSLALSPWKFFRYIASPIAIRASLPAMLNTSISLLKNSSYLQVIGFAELTFVAMDRISSDFRTLEMLSVICVIYLTLTLILSFFTKKITVALNKPYVT